jgi:hypothetical protein
MKKFTLIIVIFIFSTTAFAQKGFQVGGNFTPGLSYMLAQNHYYLAPDLRPGITDPSKELDYKPKFSYNANVFFGYNFKESHGLRLHTGYCAEGQKYEDIFKWAAYGLQGRHTKEVNFKFVNAALFYRFSPILKGQKEKNPNGNYGDGRYKIRMKMMFGIETDILVKAEMKYKIDRISKEELGLENTTVYIDNSPAPNFSQYPYILPGSPLGLPANYTAVAPFGNGGYAPYYALGKPDNQKAYFIPVQATLAFNYGFDYILKNNLYFGLGLDFKFGLNDINDKAYRIHPDYKKSKNYFFGLKAEIGYNIMKKDDASKTSKSSDKNKKEATEKDNKEDNTYKYDSSVKETKTKNVSSYKKDGSLKDKNIKKKKK